MKVTTGTAAALFGSALIAASAATANAQPASPTTRDASSAKTSVIATAQAAGVPPRRSTQARHSLPGDRGEQTTNEVRRPNNRTRLTDLPSLDSAGPFLLDQIREMVRGRWSAVWLTLYPPHRQVAPLALFVPCETATPFPAPLKQITVTTVRGTLVRVPGASARVQGAAVTVNVELTWYGPRDPIVFRHTFHLVPVAGQWTWLLSQASYQAFRNGDCDA
jgi:hypothetical protein